MFRSVVLSGGGSNGIAHAGAAAALAREGLLDWTSADRATTSFHCCSVGALFGLLMYLRVDISSAKELGMMRPFLEFFKPSLETVRRCDVGNLALCGTKGKSVIAFIETLIAKTTGIRRATFGQLHAHNKGVGGLWVCVTSLVTGNAVVMSHVTHPQVHVARAVFASMLIPFLFSPVNIGGDLYVDGAVSGQNFPLHSAAAATTPNASVVGLKLSNRFAFARTPTNAACLSFAQYFRRIISIATTRPEIRELESRFAVVTINTNNRSPVDFSPTRDEEEQLLARGRDAVARWLSKRAANISSIVTNRDGVGGGGGGGGGGGDGASMNAVSVV